MGEEVVSDYSCDEANTAAAPREFALAPPARLLLGSSVVLQDVGRAARRSAASQHVGWNRRLVLHLLEGEARTDIGDAVGLR